MPKEASLVGRKIVEIRPMTSDELEAEGWLAVPGFPIPCLVFDDGQRLFPSQDDEGNGPGTFFGAFPNGRGFRLFI